MNSTREQVDYADVQGLMRVGYRHMTEARYCLVRFHRLLVHPAPAGDADRGLRFVCLNANISRQFEFVQNAWMMSSKFNGMTGESDPLLGNRLPIAGGWGTDGFTMPREGGAGRRLQNIPRFVTVRGGAYFFLPSLRALRYLTGEGQA